MTTPVPPLDPPDDLDPDENELVTQILARRKRRTPMLTLALVVLVAAAAAFVGGIEVQKHWGSSSSSSGGGGRNATALAALAARFGSTGGTARTGASGFGGFGGGAGGFAGGGTSGTVTLIRGNDIYVTNSSGDTVIVHAATSTVTKSVTGTVKSILPGQTVTVVGTQAKNGSYTARSITIGSTSGGK